MCIGDIYFWRQCLVLITCVFYATSVGFVLSFPSVLNPSVPLTNTTDIILTRAQASWMTSVYGFAGAIGFCIIPSMMQNYGRKMALMVMNVPVAVGFIMLAFAENVATLYAARIIQGLTLCGVYLNSIIVAEYSHPKRRGYFISLQKGSVALGSLMCHALVLVCTWRQIAAIAAISNVLVTFMILTWTESPAYLAMQGRFDECDKSYIYLNGDKADNRKELENLKSAQMNRRNREEKKQERRNKVKVSTICMRFLKKEFVKPFFIITLLTIIIDASGRYYNLVYIVQIITEITGNNSIAIYCSIGLDILTVLACCTSSYVITKMSRRAMLFIFGYFSVILMFVISIIVYLKSNNIAANVLWLTPSIILLNSFVIYLGIIPVSFTLTAELFPLEYRGSGSTATGIVFTVLYAVTMKCTPIMMEETGIEGTYGIYGLCLAVCLFVLYFVLPDTKDKTLQEIEDELSGVKRGKASISQETETLATA